MQSDKWPGCVHKIERLRSKGDATPLRMWSATRLWSTTSPVLQVLIRCLEHQQGRATADGVLVWRDVLHQVLSTFPPPSVEASEVLLHCPAGAQRLIFAI